VADPRFFDRAGPLSLAQVAEIAGGQVTASAADGVVVDVADLSSATPSDLVYVGDVSYAPALATTKAGVCLTTPALATAVPNTCKAISCANPRAAFAKVAALLYPRTDAQWPTGASIAADAQIDATAMVSAGVVIGAKAKIGARVRLGANAAIGPGVSIEADSVVAANVTITHAIIGSRVIIHPGVQIGQDGFGFAAGPRGPQKVPQLGRVIIHDEVEIGANCTIDRGALADTIIGRATKLDNLVQIAHNVVIGQACIIVSQAGIAGSAVIGDGVTIGPQVGVIDHINVGSGARIAGQSGVSRNVAAKETVMGYPAKPIRQFWREIAALARLTKRG
jgi:UDP-3-O-[3-hydroxymyristoyl] glucosamine N-acyltransferase